MKREGSYNRMQRPVSKWGKNAGVGKNHHFAVIMVRTGSGKEAQQILNTGGNFVKE